MLYVEDAIALGLQDHFHHLLHAIHPGGIDIVVSIHVRSPCHRNTNDVESLGGNGIDDFLRRLGLSPLRLPFYGCLALRVPPVTVRIGIERVTEIIANHHVIDKSKGTHECISRVCSRSLL